MNIELAKSLLERSLAAEIDCSHFVDGLKESGVQFYEVNLLTRELSFFSPSGDFHVETLPIPDTTFPETAIPMELSLSLLQRSLKEYAAGNLEFGPYLRELMCAGVFLCIVFFHAGKIMYFSRSGEHHTEYLSFASAPH